MSLPIWPYDAQVDAPRIRSTRRGTDSNRGAIDEPTNASSGMFRTNLQKIGSGEGGYSGRFSHLGHLVGWRSEARKESRRRSADRRGFDRNGEEGEEE